MKAKEESLRIVKRLRLLIYLLDLTQVEVEQRVGFSSGYLTQLLHGTVEIKLWHLLAILEAIQIDPAEFFAELFPPQRSPAVNALEQIRRGPRRHETPLTLELARLYRLGIESLDDLLDRLARCEDAVAELRRLGVLNDLDGAPDKPGRSVERQGRSSTGSCPAGTSRRKSYRE